MLACFARTRSLLAMSSSIFPTCSKCSSCASSTCRVVACSRLLNSAAMPPNAAAKVDYRGLCYSEGGLALGAEGARFSGTRCSVGAPLQRRSKGFFVAGPSQSPGFSVGAAQLPDFCLARAWRAFARAGDKSSDLGYQSTPAHCKTPSRQPC